MTRTEHAGWRSRGYLPHLDVPHIVQHVVFRLADSLPASVHDRIVAISAAGRADAVDDALDRGLGHADLAIPEIAALVQNALLHFDGERYAVVAWCIMPNHVHVLVEPFEGHRLDAIVRNWKSFAAHAANRALRRAGAFWAPEYFDRYVRDDRHLAAVLAYIEDNPVKAGLCSDKSDWPYSSAWSEWGGRDARAP